MDLERVNRFVLGKHHLTEGRFISEGEVRLKECDGMVLLTKRKAGGVMSPLRDC